MPDKGNGTHGDVKLGVMYHNGEGGEQDFRDLARKWFKRAAERREHGEAMYFLG